MAWRGKALTKDNGTAAVWLLFGCALLPFMIYFLIVGITGHSSLGEFIHLPVAHELLKGIDILVNGLLGGLPAFLPAGATFGVMVLCFVMAFLLQDTETGGVWEEVQELLASLFYWE